MEKLDFSTVRGSNEFRLYDGGRRGNNNRKLYEVRMSHWSGPNQMTMQLDRKQLAALHLAIGIELARNRSGAEARGFLGGRQ